MSTRQMAVNGGEHLGGRASMALFLDSER
uniref:Uncharacterized protein MANES_16G129900 n=1 Tax=Rhizophora mucronata TaxID=61149 RepID=A0A2P2JEK4_RHIMU